MPGVARILTLNLGSQAISVADFRLQSGGGLVLRDYKRRDLVIENPGEPVRHAQITSTIREILNELGIKSANVNYAAAGQEVFAQRANWRQLGDGGAGKRIQRAFCRRRNAQKRKRLRQSWRVLRRSR